MTLHGFRKLILVPAALLLILTPLKSQGVLDKVVAIVGNDVVLLSDVEQQYLQYLAQGYSADENMKCNIFEGLLIQKLMINQAKIDSVEVSESSVEMALNRRIDYFVRQIGSKEKLETYFKKTILEIKEEFRPLVREQALSEQMQGEITSGLGVTPSEVEDYYKSIPTDSIPIINSEVEYQQICMYPPYTEKAIFDTKEQLLELRKRIQNGESFSTLAVLYCEDASAVKGGELGFMSKGQLDPDFANAAFALKPGQVSKIVQSKSGFHLIQLIERRDDMVNVRHILIKPKTAPDDELKTKLRLDSLITLIKNDSISFDKAALYYSQDEDSKLSGGIVVNPETETTKFEMDQLNRPEYNVIRNMKEGEMSEIIKSIDKQGRLVFKVIKLKSRTKPHKANMDTDLNIIKQMALTHKQQKIIDNWIDEKIKTTYIHIDDKYKACKFIHNWNK